MNKNIKKLGIAALACVALCGTTLAAPRHHGGPRGHRPPPPRHHAPRHQVIHHVHHDGCEATGWTILGAAAIGGIVGALLN